MATKYQSLRGMKDTLGEDSLYFELVVDVASAISKTYGYNLLITPILEVSEIFHRSIGETSDIISKETYTFNDRDNSSVTLRPEFTAGVVRAVISNGLTQSLPQKFFSYGPLFRHERPQKGRYRQFNQVNFEYFGAVGHGSDVEVILMATRFLRELGLLDKTELNINSIGDTESRKVYREALVSYLSKYINDLSEDSKVRLEKNPMRILDSKDEGDRKIVEGAPLLSNYLNDYSKKYFDEILEALTRLHIEYKVNPMLVRGLDYYSHTAFEFVTSELGSQGTVIGGGRYDGLSEIMGGPAIPAIGFAAGIERLYELKKIISPSIFTPLIVYLVPIGLNAESYAFELAENLRDAGIQTELDYSGNVGKRFKRADKIGAKYTIVFGDDEIKQGKLKLKDMATGQEKEIELNDILDYLI